MGRLSKPAGALWRWARRQGKLITPLDWRRDKITRWASGGRVGWQPEAADFNLAVTLVAPWEEYVIDLSPKFDLDAEKALDYVIPNTAQLEEKIVDGWSASVQASVAAKTSAAAATPKRATARQKAAGQIHQEPTEDVPDEAAEDEAAKGGKEKEGTQVHGKSAAAGAERAQSKRSGHGQTIGKDPMLEHTAATAFFQEVKLLNRYVADAALRRNHRAYVVRLQMSIVPFARHLPFDVYSNISFFPALEPHDKTYASKFKRFHAEVIPLLVTDNLENTIKSRTVDSLRDLALTLNFLQPVRGGIGLSRRRQQFKRALGGDLNSLLTVGRVSDNTLQVRLGAVQDVTSGSRYAMIPRTHNITVLLLVPAEFAENTDDAVVPRVNAVAKTQLRDAETGMDLPHQSQDDRREAVEELCRPEVLRHERSNVADKLLRNVFSNDVRAFEHELKDAKFSKLLYDNGLETNWEGVLNPAGSQSRRLQDVAMIARGLSISAVDARFLSEEFRRAVRAYTEFETALVEAGTPKGDAQKLWSAIVRDPAVIEHVGLERGKIQGAIEQYDPSTDVLRRFEIEVELVELPSTLAGREIFGTIADAALRKRVTAALWFAVGHFGRFEGALKDACAQPSYMLDLWCSIVETFGKSEFAAVRFELPPPVQLPDDESILAVDDGTRMIVRLQGGAGLNQNGVTATLFVTTKGGDRLPIVPNAETPGAEINILAGGHGMTIMFPSLAAWKIELDRLGNLLRGAELTVTYGKGRKWSRAEGAPSETYDKIFYLHVESTASSGKASGHTAGHHGDDHSRSMGGRPTDSRGK